MSNWTDICVSVPTAAAELAADIAGMVSPYGVYIEDYSDLEQAAWEIAHIDIIDSHLLAKDRTTAIIHIYIAQSDSPAECVGYITDALTANGIEHAVSLSGIKEEDWANNWRKYFHATKIGSRLCVCPSWEKYISSDRTVLTIDPGAAFGTGTHDTTRLCLAELDRLVVGGESILDIGCGSGILAVAGLLLGCSDAVGVDIDPIAVGVANDTARLNRVDNRAAFHCGDLTEQVSGKFDIICANIVADVIIRLCDDVVQFMHSDSRLLCSGIIDTREGDVLAALESHGLSVESRLQSGGWVALTVRLA